MHGAASTLIYPTYRDGREVDQANGGAFESCGNTRLAGGISSISFPVPRPANYRAVKSLRIRLVSICKGLRRASGFRRRGEGWRFGSRVLDLADCTPSDGWDGERSRFDGVRPINVSSRVGVCISGQTSSVAPEGGNGQWEVTLRRRVGEPPRTPHARIADASRKGRKRNADVGACGLRALHHHDRLRISHAAGRAGLGSVAAQT